MQGFISLQSGYVLLKKFFELFIGKHFVNYFKDHRTFFLYLYDDL